MPSQNRPCNACLRQSQQVCEIPPFDPKSAFLLRLGNTTDNFKESPIVDNGQRYQSSQSQQLSETRLPAIPHKCDSITRYHVTRSQPATQPIRLHYIQRHTPHGYSMARHSTAHRHGTAWEQGISFYTRGGTA